MPEIKKNFTRGKMNRDLDERLVPNGEYRHAMNVQVSTSDESSVGTIQNILGNSTGCLEPTSQYFIDVGSTTVGSIADESKDTLYWLIAGFGSDSVSGIVANLIDNGLASTSLKDMIMQKSPSGCDHVFVDVYGFVVLNNDVSPFVTNNITLSNTSLYENITSGMTVTGYDSSGGITFESNNITNIGSVTTVPISYAQLTSTIPTSIPQTPVVFDDSTNKEIYLRTFDNNDTPSGNSTDHVFNLFMPHPDGTNSYQLNLPPTGVNGTFIVGNPTDSGRHQFWIRASDWDSSIVVGSVISSVIGFNGMLVLNGVASTIIEAIDFGQVCDNLQPLTQGGCQPAYLITIGHVGISTGWSGSWTDTYELAGTTFEGDRMNYKGFYCTITPPSIDIYDPTHQIQVNPTSSNWTDEIYLALQSGATVQINNNIGAGAVWPLNSCIDPNSVTSSTDVDYDIINCDTGAFVAPTEISYKPLQFTISGGTAVESIYLQDPVSLGVGINGNETSALYFSSERVLNFDSSRLITGINIVDDMLFWTDNFSEPKKINIPNSIEGTTSGLLHTKLVNPNQSITAGANIPVREKHVTVIKKSPKNKLTVRTDVNDDFAFGVTNPNFNFLIDPNDALQGNHQLGDVFPVVLHTDPLASSNELNVNDILNLNPVSDANLPQDEYQASVILQQMIDDGSTGFELFGTVIFAPGTYQIWNVQLNTLNDDVSSSGTTWNWAVRTPVETFKNKFPRYSYRYKYQDGEYSSFAPFTNVIFEPDKELRYDTKDAFNKSMENNIVKTTLLGYADNLPKDVVEIDLLYKESNSPVVYTIDTIRHGDLLNTTAGYEVNPTQIRAALPENQLLRPYDNVPRKALAQEVTANRLVYGNYLQNYDIQENYSTISAELVNRGYCGVDDTTKSIKSIRTYTLGVSYLDKYGRQSPVLTNKNADLKVPITKSNNVNQLEVSLSGEIPEWATHYKVFVKDTANDYYNLAMERIYEAEDDNFWISFPSSDRNKVDEETFLILKKGIEGSPAINDPNRYKILAIENEAPEFVKTKKVYYGAVDNSDPLVLSYGTGTGALFDDANNYPITTSRTISMLKSAWDGVAPPLSDLYTDTRIVNTCVQLFLKDGGVTQTTKQYDVSFIDSGDTTDPSYLITLEKKIDEDWVVGALSTVPHDDLSIRIYKKDVKEEAQFDGRFFVKISKDPLVDKYIIKQAVENGDLTYQATAQLNFNYVADANATDPSINPSTGVDYATTNGSGSVQNGNGSLDLDEWQAIAKALHDGACGAYGCWFIDGVRSAGYYKNDASELPGVNGGTDYYLNKEGMWKIGPVSITGTAVWMNHVPLTSQNHSYGKGIWTDDTGSIGPAGQVYMDLSFSWIKSEPGTEGDYSDDLDQLHTNEDDLGSAQVDKAKKYFAGLSDGVDITTGSGAWDADGKKRAFYEDIHDWQGTDNMTKHWRVGSPSTNPPHGDEQSVVNKLYEGSKFKFATGGTIYTMGEPIVTYHLNYYSTKDMDEVYAEQDYISPFLQDGSGTYVGYEQATVEIFRAMEELGHSRNRRVRWTIPIFDQNGNSINPRTEPNGDQDPLSITIFGDLTDSDNGTPQSINTIQFVEEEWVSYDDQVIPEKPAIWETEPKEDVDLDIYYEIDSAFPLIINNDTNYSLAPIGTGVEVVVPDGAIPSTQPNTTVVGWSNNIVEISSLANDADVPQNAVVVFSRQDGSCVRARLMGFGDPVTEDAAGNNTSSFLIIDPDISSAPISLSWFNCYSFNNGVESSRIRDSFNAITIDKGPKASSTLSEPYEQERRKSGLIYSGIYNSTSGVNNLNQFIQAEKITKDVNTTYGSIQRLHTRDSDLLALCEDKVLKILSQKDALFNADGNTNVTATSNVLGQTIPFVGEYGISKNPESFASESYRVYFSDKTRGAIMRLSRDGLTPISDQGMRDWFRDNLKLSNRLIGSYDDKKDEYNITVKGGPNDYVVSYKENVKGWVSFKSFVDMENAISCANEYYTFRNGILWQHHSNEQRNTFYDYSPKASTFTAILNDAPGIVKSFNTLNYEGSPARVVENLLDEDYYNLLDITGWHVVNLKTNKEKGSIDEFIEKEGKWFNYIRGKAIEYDENTGDIDTNTFDQASLAIQGVGKLIGITQAPIAGCMDDGNCTLANCGYNSNTPAGCLATNSCLSAFNYDPTVTVDNGSCLYPIIINGCMEPSADNYNPIANVDDLSCSWTGCADVAAVNYGLANGNPWPAIAWTYNSGSNWSSVGCIAAVSGCTDATMFNYNLVYTTACTDVNGVTNGTGGGCCEPFVDGCTFASADNADPAANTDDGTCIWTGCINPDASNYGQGGTPWANIPGALTYTPAGSQYGMQDDGSCPASCGDDTACNYDAAYVLNDPLLCGYCTDVNFGIDANSVGTSQVSLDNGAIAITPSVGANGFHPDYLNGVDYNYFYTITDVNGVVIVETGDGSGWANNQTFNGIPSSGTQLFHNLAAGDYTITTTYWCVVPLGATPPPSGSNCGSFTETITVNDAPAILGCTDITACNYDAAADTDNGLCEFTSCAGCMDPLADNNNLQTGESAGGTFCVDSATGAAGSCVIPCGDGSDATDLGTDCCDYTVYGCDDPTANNYVIDTNPNNDPGTYTLVGDGSCTFDVFGCTDPAANNYDVNATVDDGSCTYAAVSGCMQADACNYDPLANQDDGSCMTQVGNPVWGDASSFNGASGGVNYYSHQADSATSNSSDGHLKHYLTTAFAVAAGGSAAGYGRFDDNYTNGSAIYYDYGVDLGLGVTVPIPYDDGVIYNGAGDFNEVTLHIQRYNLATTTWDDITQAIGDFSVMKPNEDASQNVISKTLGPVPRENAYLPAPAGGPTHNGGGNYQFPITETDPWGGTVNVMYRILAEQRVNGIKGRDLHFLGLHSSNPCIGSTTYQFQEQPCSESPFSVVGCMDPGACNYDSTANCSGGATCYFPTATWWYSPDPGNAACEECYLGVNSGECTDGVATCPAGALGEDYYSDLSTCTSETGAQ